MRLIDLIESTLEKDGFDECKQLRDLQGQIRRHTTNLEDFEENFCDQMLQACAVETYAAAAVLQPQAELEKRRKSEYIGKELKPPDTDSLFNGTKTISLLKSSVPNTDMSFFDSSRNSGGSSQLLPDNFLECSNVAADQKQTDESVTG